MKTHLAIKGWLSFLMWHQWKHCIKSKEARVRTNQGFFSLLFRSVLLFSHPSASAVSFGLDLSVEDCLIKNVFASHSTLGSLESAMENIIMERLFRSVIIWYLNIYHGIHKTVYWKNLKHGKKYFLFLTILHIIKTTCSQQWMCHNYTVTKYSIFSKFTA